MKSADRTKLREKLEGDLEPYRKAARKYFVNKLWVKEMRQALGVPTTEIAKRMGVDRSWVYRLEENEEKGRVNLHDLGEAAQAMECRLIYGFVPFQNRTLEETARSLKEYPQWKTPRIKAKWAKREKKRWDGHEEWKRKQIWVKAADRKAAEVRARVMARAKACGWSLEEAERGLKTGEGQAPVAGSSGSDNLQGGFGASAAGGAASAPRTAEEMKRQGVGGAEALRDALQDYVKRRG
jgi:transcriptional regulator with XRE-family HTH domain